MASKLPNHGIIALRSAYLPYTSIKTLNNQSNITTGVLSKDRNLPVKSIIITREYSKNYNSNGHDNNFDLGSPLIRSLSGNTLRTKMQEIGSSSPTMATQGSYSDGLNETCNNNREQLTPKENEDDAPLANADPNISMWRAINSDHKEVEEKPKDQAMSIQNYYKERWIQEHRDKRSDNITGQAVKVMSEEPTQYSSSSPTPHESSIYRQLAKKITANNKHKHQSHKDNHDSAANYDQFKTSRRISANHFAGEEFKEEAEGLRGRASSPAPKGMRDLVGGVDSGPYVSPKFDWADAIAKQPRKTKDNQHLDENNAYREGMTGPRHDICEMDDATAETAHVRSANNSRKVIVNRNPNIQDVSNDPNWMSINNEPTNWAREKPKENQGKEEIEAGNGVAFISSEPMTIFKPDI